MENDKPDAANGAMDSTNIPYEPALAAGISEEWDRKNARRIELALKKSRKGLSAEEETEFQSLQEGFFAYL